MSKKYVMLVSIAGTFLTSLSLFSNDLALSGYICPRIDPNICWYYIRDIKDIADPFIFLFPLVLLFSLITYRMKDEVFRAWLHFAYWWIPLSIILTLVTPDGSGGWGIPSLISREIVAITFASLFAIISIILIAYKYLSTRPNW